MKLIVIGCVAAAMSISACGKKAEPTPAPAAATKPAEPEAKPAAKPEAEPAAKPEAEPPAKPAVELPPAEGAWQDVPNINGLVADVPADAEPNGVGGAAGFHKKDGSYQWALNLVADERKALTLDQIKAETEQFLHKKWVKAEATADGWVIVHEMAKIDGDGNEAGVVHAFTVRRMIGDKLFDCSGGLDVATGIDASVKSCQSVRPKG